MLLLAEAVTQDTVFSFSVGLIVMLAVGLASAVLAKQKLDRNSDDIAALKTLHEKEIDRVKSRLRSLEKWRTLKRGSALAERGQDPDTLGETVGPRSSERRTDDDSES